MEFYWVQLLLIPLFFVSDSSTYVIDSPIINASSFTYSSQDDSKPEIINLDDDPVCTTPECVAAASVLVESMNTSADPCQDFYQYACGGWVAKHKIPKSKSRWTQFDILDQQLSSEISKILSASTDPEDPIPVNQARDYFAACMDTKLLENIGLKPLTDFLGSFGGWPMTLSQWNEKAFSWQKATTAATRLYNTGTLLSVSNGVDQKNTSRNTIYIDQASFLLPREELIDPSSAKQDMAAYIAYITGTAKAIRDSLKSDATDAQIEQDVKDLWNFESELAKITTSDENRRNNTRMYNPMSLAEIQKWTDSVSTTSTHAKVNWLPYLNEIYYLGASIKIPSSERVVVVETEYLKKLISLLDQTPLRTIANYVHWNFVNQIGSETTQQMKDLEFEFNKVIQGTAEPTPLSITCAETANSLLGYAITYKYVASTFTDQAKNETMVMIENLREAFKSLVDEATWMDSDTKVIAKDKADFMVENIGFPDWINNRTALENYYSGVSISPMDPFGNLKNAKAFSNAQSFKNLRGPTDRHFWEMFPTIVNAMYEPQLNSITFPAGILQIPFFGHGRLSALNYGGIGAVIGHEITHGFDDQGRQSDKFGNTVDWWTNATLANYLVRSQCFIDQYNNFTVPSGSHVNGVTTQGENIADNGGVREAFRAYKLYVAAHGAEPKLPGLEAFTPEQLFFLGYANNWCGTQTPENLEYQIKTNPHSPGNFRVLGPLSNNDDFVREFNCPVGSPMNRNNKCILW